MKLRFGCPKCGARLQVPADCRGRMARCAGCDDEIRVPDESAETELVDAAGSTSGQDPLQPLVIQPSNAVALAVNHEDTAEEDDDPFFLSWERRRRRRQLLVGSLAVTLVVVAGLFHAEIRTGLTRANHRLIEIANPARLEIPTTDLASSSDTKDSLIPGVVEASVRISVQGIDRGSGVVCSIVGDQAFILTTRSVVDQLYWVTGNPDARYDVPAADVRYADDSTATAEVVWRAEDGIDLAILRASGVSRDVRSANWRGLKSVAEGDAVFFVCAEDNAGWSVAETDVRDVHEQMTRGDRAIPMVRINAGRLTTGAGLYNSAGELVAIAGNTDPVARDLTRSAIRVSLLSQLRPAALNLGSNHMSPRPY